ncbi:uncharacterized protein LOC121379557 [Gigantopelta aegis]|uniref:uncharacterized protein LOC121379557 n=1 Tax=Gigantopelta aegis TaxID=1735272 RepID=UPI001B8891F1|nr:uncharacterized protein LOC121379557 [Gigantopelta aegis]
MSQNLVDNLSVTQIKRSKRADLVEIAKDRNIDIEQAKTISEMRDIIIAESFGVEEDTEGIRVEQIDPIPEVEGVTLSAEQQVAFKKLEWEMEMKRWDREKDENERERQFQIEKMRMEHEFRMREGEPRGAPRDHGRNEVDSQGFRLSEAYRLVPVFEENHVDKFFQLFERMAQELLWPKEKWSLLAQSRFRGKASEAYSALSDGSARDYEVLKEAVLRAYELTGEAYRQKFRHLKKLESQTYAEFIAVKSRLFDQWIRSQKSGGSYEKLREMVILEDVKNGLPMNVRMHLEDKQVDSLEEAAASADNFSLIHKVQSTQSSFNYHQNSRKPQFGSASVKPSGFHYVSSLAGSGKHRVQQRPSVLGQVDQRSQLSAQAKPFRPRCSYCHMDNHVIADCFKWRRDNSKVVALVQQEERCKQSRLTGLPERNMYEAYISSGKICDVRLDHPPTPVTIYRDTGAGQSLIVQGGLNKVPHSYTGKSVVLTAVGGQCMTVPLHEIYLSSQFVTGKVIVGVVPHLPFANVHVLLGNDLSDKCCQKRCDQLEVQEVPISVVDKDIGDIKYPACATTRSMTRKAKIRPADDINLSETFLSHEAESELGKRNTGGEIPYSGVTQPSGLYISAREV